MGVPGDPEAGGGPHPEGGAGSSEPPEGSGRLRESREVVSVSVQGAEQMMLLPEPGLPYLRHHRAGEISLAHGSLSARDGRIAALEEDRGAELRVDAAGCSILPGFVDSHTHLPFIGWRAEEYALKVAGAGYEEVSRAGGGIASSARALASATDADVLAHSGSLAEEMLESGTTAFEQKSGYGLSREGELRALRLALRLADRVVQETTSTALLAHAVPEGHTADSWLSEVEGMLPAVVSEAAASAVDIFVESVAFGNPHLERMGELACRYGLALRCHVEQFATHRSVPIALDCGARSVDHLACLHPDDLAPLAAAECAAVLLPGAEFLGAEEVAPARELADAGAIAVLATDANPGTSPILSIPTVLGLAVRRYRWTAREALLAATLNAAWTIDRWRELGSLEVGKRADFLLCEGRVEEIPYRFARNPVVAAFVAGQPAYVRPGEERRLR